MSPLDIQATHRVPPMVAPAEPPAGLRGRGSPCGGDGGDEGTRTPDPRDANAVLSQLSYIPTRARGSLAQALPDEPWDLIGCDPAARDVGAGSSAARAGILVRFKPG